MITQLGIQHVDAVIFLCNELPGKFLVLKGFMQIGFYLWYFLIIVVNILGQDFVYLLYDNFGQFYKNRLVLGKAAYMGEYKGCVIISFGMLIVSIH